MLPVRSNPQAAVAKWLSGIGNSTERMTAGANAVTKAPGQSAAAAADKWLQRVTQAKVKFATNVARVTLQEWQNAYINIGVPRVSQGAQAKQGKFLSFMEEYLPYLNRGLQTIDQMPSVTLEDGIARATAMIRYNAKFKRGVTAP